jgi:hypothetical protein
VGFLNGLKGSMKKTKNQSRASRRAAPPCSANHFHIDVRSNTFNVGDMEWAQILVTLNLVLQRQWPHVGAYLEELPNAEAHGRRSRTVQPLVGASELEGR